MRHCEGVCVSGSWLLSLSPPPPPRRRQRAGREADVVVASRPVVSQGARAVDQNDQGVELASYQYSQRVAEGIDRLRVDPTITPYRVDVRWLFLHHVERQSGQTPTGFRPSLLHPGVQQTRTKREGQESGGEERPSCGFWYRYAGPRVAHLKIEAAAACAEIERIADGGENAGFAEARACRSEIVKADFHNVAGAEFEINSYEQFRQPEAEGAVGCVKPRDPHRLGDNGTTINTPLPGNPGGGERSVLMP